MPYAMAKKPQAMMIHSAVMGLKPSV